MDALLGVVFVAQLPSQPPDVIFVYPPQQDVDGATADQPAGDVPSSPPVEDTVQIRECFGIPGMKFATLMLPNEELCNRPLCLEIDAGPRETSHHHDSHSHLHLASFPCYVSEFSRLNACQPDAQDPDPLDPRERVQRFNVVHILDSRRTRRWEKQFSTLWQVSAHLARALVSEEARVSYLSKEIRRLTRAQQGDHCGRASEARRQLDVPVRWSLERLVADMFEGVHRCGYRSLRVNGSILCQVCVFPKHEAPAPPTKTQALVLTCPREELQEELPADSADIVRCVIANVSPTVSLGELMVRLALPLSTLQRVSQHLVYWKRARVVDVFRPHTRVAVAPEVDTSSDSPASLRFHEWQKRRKFKPHELTLSKVISEFSGGRELRSVREQLCPDGEEFSRVLEWVVAEGLVLQLALYYHFLPSGARSGTPRSSCNFSVKSKICQEFQKHLTDSEVDLLATRAKDHMELLFLCRLAEGARAHLRADGAQLDELVASLEHGGERGRAEELLRRSRDVLVPYVCRC